MRTARLLLWTLFGFATLASAADAQQLVDPSRRQYSQNEPDRVSLDQAAQMAQSRYHARAVKAETVTQGGRRVHKIRLMNAEGKVWHVHVDAQTARMY